MSNSKDSKKIYWLVILLIVFILTVLIIADAISFPALNNTHNTMIPLALIVTVGLVLYMLSRNLGVSHSEALLKLVLATLFGVFFQLAVSYSPDEKLWKALLDTLDNRLVSTLTIVIVAFALGLVADAAEVTSQAAGTASKTAAEAEKFKQSADRLKDAAENYEAVAREFVRGATEHRYAGVAARILSLRTPSLLGLAGTDEHGDRRPDEKLLDALEASVDSLRTWIFRGNFESKAEPHSSHSYCRDLWWRIMRIYQQEEIYDTARYELATNVRNFAFILLGIIAELRERVIALNEETKASAHKVVVVNCTPFAPKDFYNYPDGLADNRFYHERPFFGTYRRVLTALAQDNVNIEMHRIVLADPAVEWPDEEATSHTLAARVDESDKNVAVGWPLDSIWDLARDSARFFVLPAPLPLSLSKTGLIVYGRRADEQKELGDLGVLLAPNFPPKHDPRRRLPKTTETPMFFWLPFFAKLDRPKSLTTDARWWKKPRKFEKSMNGSLPSKRLSEVYSNRIEVESVVTDIMKRSREIAWKRLRKQVENCCLSTDTINRTFQEIKDEVRRRFADKQREEGLSAFFEGEILALAQSWSQLVVEVKDGGGDRTQRVCSLVSLVQILDSQIAVLQQSFGEDVHMSSTNSQLGLAEAYLHRLLAEEEWNRMKQSFRATGPLPVWRLFFGDCLLGETWEESGCDKLQDYLNKAKERFRVAPVRDFENLVRREGAEEFFWSDGASSAQQKCDPSRFVKGELFPEFLLIGERESGSGEEKANALSDVTWRALVAAQMNEPFDTCRLVVRFPDSESGELFENHVAWVREIFNKSGSNGGRFAWDATETFFEKLKECMDQIDYPNQAS